MNATDAFLGILIILLVVWATVLQLQLTTLSNTVSGIAKFGASQGILFSPKELCREKQGVELVQENTLSEEEYIVAAGKEKEQKYFCFYRKE